MKCMARFQILGSLHPDMVNIKVWFCFFIRTNHNYLQTAFISSKQMAYIEFWFYYSVCPSFSSWLQHRSSGCWKGSPCWTPPGCSNYEERRQGKDKMRRDSSTLMSAVSKIHEHICFPNNIKWWNNYWKEVQAEPDLSLLGWSTVTSLWKGRMGAPASFDSVTEPAIVIWYTAL